MDEVGEEASDSDAPAVDEDETQVEDAEEADSEASESTEDLEEWENHGKTPAALGAVQWKRVVELTWKEKELLKPTNYIEIRYEDFVMTAHDIMHELVTNIGLADSAEVHQYLSSFGEIKNMNYKFSHNLTDDEVNVIETITEKVAAKAGYSFSTV